MKFISKLFILVALILPMSIDKVSAKPQWKTLCSDNQFCFDYPTLLKPRNQQVIDSSSGYLSDDQLELYYDYGMYSSDFDELIDASTSFIEINGFKAKVFQAGNIIAVHMANIKSVPVMNNHIKFSMEIRFKKQLDVQLAEQIFQSIRFSNH